MATAERILITGATGFLGACLARDRICAGHDVHLLARATSPNWRLAELEGQYVRHEADLRDADALCRAVAACRPDVIYHLAAYGAYPTQQDTTTILATNLLGTANLLEALASHDYRALVHTGSSSEYGHKLRPMRDNDLPEPRTPYAVGKAAATLLCRAEAMRGRPVATVRVFSPYGPWDDPSRLVPYVMSCCARDEVVRVTSGRQPRDFIYVDDCVNLIVRTADCQEARGQILHAGSGQQQSVRDVVEAIVGVCGGDPEKIRFGDEPTRADEPEHWSASIERTTALTGWRPEVELREGLARTWSWCLAHAEQEANLPSLARH
jgi:nucleoside-diphosphate-sugar epimerase